MRSRRQSPVLKEGYRTIDIDVRRGNPGRHRGNGKPDRGSVSSGHKHRIGSKDSIRYRQIEKDSGR